ncbi:MAG: hypothetical protein LIO62_00605 [Clostridiales bacterium]|nr:hypothetical protein [Clostridiales bacterium]
MIFFDTNKAAVHIDAVSEEKRIAQILLDNLKMIKRLAYAKYDIDPNLSYEFQQIIKMTDELVEYYTRIVTAMSNISDDAIKIILDTERMLDDTQTNVNDYIDM